MSVDYTLMIVMRNDIASLLGGKACAQAAHAGSMSELVLKNKGPIYCKDNWFPSVNVTRDWAEANHTKFIGESWAPRTLVFGERDFGESITGETLRILNSEFHFEGILADIYCDPSFPVSDGKFTATAKVETCMFAIYPTGSDQEKIAKEITKKYYLSLMT